MMIYNIQTYFTFEMIYIWANIGILPFWLILLTIPNSKINQILINSIFLPSILSFTYCYICYQIIFVDDNIFQIFSIYFGLENLYILFSDERFLLIFWIHFLALSLFLGSWMSRDGCKYNMPRTLVAIPLCLAYFAGPLGLILYWFIRIFFAKKIGLHD